MKTSFRDLARLVALTITAVALCAFAAAAQKQTKPVVLILGTYHMGNPNQDLHNVTADDVRSEKRQKEIAEVVAALKKFQPTKIAVEIPAARPTYLESYAQFLAGKYELKANEVDQIAFRLGRELNQKQLYPIDWKGKFDFDKVLASAKTNNQTALTDEMMKFGKTYVEKMNEMQKTATIMEILRYMNDEKNVEASHRPYIALSRVGGAEDYAGADLAGDWYERNLKIFANITRITASPDERILVVIGAGHAKLLQQFVRESGEYELAQANSYF